MPSLLSVARLSLIERSVALRPRLAKGLPLSWTVYYSAFLQRFFEAFGSPHLHALAAEHGDKVGRSLGDFFMEELYSFVG